MQFFLQVSDKSIFCAILQVWYGVIISVTVFIGSISFLYVLRPEKHLMPLTLLWFKIKISCWFPRYLYEIYFPSLITSQAEGFLRLVFLASSILSCIFGVTETRDIAESFKGNNKMRGEQSGSWTFMVCPSPGVLELAQPHECRDCRIYSCLAAPIQRQPFRLKEQMCSQILSLKSADYKYLRCK